MLKINFKERPFFTIITCTFNRNYIIDRAIESVINQNFKDWELIIVDDGSNDSTYEKVTAYCKKNVNIRYLFHSNRKISFSRNAGILASTGHFITFLDSDDEYLPDHLEQRFKVFNNDKTIDFIHGGVKIIGNEFVPDVNDKSKMIHLSECVIGGTFFIKREKTLELEGFENLEYGDDNIFFNKAKEKGLNIHKVDFPTYIYYRDLPDSICNNL